MLLVVLVVSIVLMMLTGLVTTAHRSVTVGDGIIRNAQSARAAIDRVAADFRACVYYGPAARYAAGLDGVAGRAPDFVDPSLDIDRITLVTAGSDRARGEAGAPDDEIQRGRADLRLVTYEVQWDAEKGRGRLIRIEQGVLDAVDNGEITVEVLCEDVQTFRLQYYGQVPADSGVSDAGATSSLGEYQWLRDWRTGLHGLAESEQTAESATPATPKDYPLPAAIHIVLALKPPEGTDLENESERRRTERWFETIVSVPGSAELVKPPGQVRLR